MIRKVNGKYNLYLCQSCDWQSVIQAEDEESAATISVQEMMKESSEEYSLSMVVAVLKLRNNIFDDFIDEDAKLFYSPLILANAGFHNESKNLHELLSKQELEQGEENE
jgi:hypothetical protein